jgi:hypothetical protein
VDVVVENLVKVMKTAVMHIGRANGYIAQRGRAEFTDVGGVVGELIDTKVVGGVGEFPSEVVKAVVLKFNAVSIVRCLIDGLASEGEPTVASGTAQRGMEKEVFAALGRFGDRILFMAVAVMVVGRVPGNEGPLKGSEGLANMDEAIGA